MFNSLINLGLMVMASGVVLSISNLLADFNHLVK